MIRQAGIVLALVGSVFLSGCATNRSEVAVSLETTAPSVAVAKNGRQVAVSVVVDERVFQDGSADPSVPSLGFEGSAAASDAMKARAIARKRNTYGKALGDVVLQDGQSVAKLVREVTEQGLADAGFTVVPAANAASGVTTVEVRIKQFWSWMTPGFWALTFENKIEAVVQPAGKSATSLAAYAQDSGQLGTDGAYVGIVMKGLSDYRSKLAAWAKGAGF